MEAITTKVNKSEYEVVEFNSGYFGIAKIGTFKGELVLGGDSANEDDYNKDFFDHTFELWDGELNEDGKIDTGKLV